MKKNETCATSIQGKTAEMTANSTVRLLDATERTFLGSTEADKAVIDAWLHAAGRCGKQVVMVAVYWADCKAAAEAGKASSLDFALSQLMHILCGELCDPRAAIQTFRVFEPVVRAQRSAYPDTHIELSRCYASLGEAPADTLAHFYDNRLKKAS